MNWRIKAALALVVAGALVVGTRVLLKHHSQPQVTVTLRLAVSPADQVDFVMGRANSAQFKYLMGKQTGLKPALAQKLSLHAVPHTSLVEGRIAVPTTDDARHYVEAFVPTLQDLCGQQAQVTLANQAIR